MQTFWAGFLHEIPAAVTLLMMAYGLLVVSWPVFLWMEWLSPVQPGTPRSNYLFNWKVVLCNLLLTPVFYAIAVAFSQALARVTGLPALPYPFAEWSLGIPVLDTLLQAVVLFFTAVFLNDFWYYWWHRMQHELPALWELHKLHHSDENLNATTIYRSHFLELAGQALVRGTTVGLLVDLSSGPQTVLAAVVAGLLPAVWDFFIHANVRIDALHRVLPVLSTPQFHWIHHSKLPQHQDKNYAIWLPIFDVVFGSYYAPALDEYPPTGLSSGERIETMWEAQAGPLLAWLRMLRGGGSAERSQS